MISKDKLIKAMQEIGILPKGSFKAWQKNSILKFMRENLTQEQLDEVYLRASNGEHPSTMLSEKSWEEPQIKHISSSNSNRNSRKGIKYPPKKDLLNIPLNQLNAEQLRLVLKKMQTMKFNSISMNDIDDMIERINNLKNRW